MTDAGLIFNHGSSDQNAPFHERFNGADKLRNIALACLANREGFSEVAFFRVVVSPCFSGFSAVLLRPSPFASHEPKQDGYRVKGDRFQNIILRKWHGF